MQTQAQKDLKLAYDLITNKVANKNKQVQNIYGGLCHSFPIMVRTCGLCQAVAFSSAKTQQGENNDRKEAHRLLLEHVGEILKSLDDGLNNAPVQAMREADSEMYMLYTRRVLAAWIYFKRFAESILQVDSAKEKEE